MLRASDADRDRVAEVLRSAAGAGRLTLDELQDRLEVVFAAKTYAELEPVVEGLPTPADMIRTERSYRTRLLADAQSRGLPSVNPIGGIPMSRTTKAIFSGVTRRGQWVVPAYHRVRAVFGNACLDLRQARLERSAVVIDVEAVFGEVTIVVGPYVTVIVDGYAVVGDFGGNAEETQPPVDAFVGRVIGKAVFGSVNVRRKDPTAP